MITGTVRLSWKPKRESYTLADNQRALLMPIGDVHYGTDGWPRQKFIDHLKWGMDRGAVFVGMGEFLDLASYSQQKVIANLRDDVREQMDEMVKDQAGELYELMEFTRGRWIGLLEGDHRWDFMDATSVDQYFAGRLNTKFLGTSALLRLMPYDRPFDHPEADTMLFVHHGIGSSRSAGGHLNRVEDLLKWVQADIYLMGHTHAKVAAPIDRQVMTPDGVHHHRTTIIARTGGWLRGYYSHEPLDLKEPALHSRGSYVEQKAYTPSAMGGLVIGIGFERVHHSEYYRPTLHFSL
jgi:hypothetical protein